MVEQRAVAVLGVGELLGEVRQHLHVILVDFRELFDQRRVLAVMRDAMEALIRGRAFRIAPSGQIAREQQGADAGDIGLVRQSQQVEHQLDVLVEGLGNAGRHSEILGRRRRCVGGDRKPPFDLADVLGETVEA
jgi:hypothetical protein